MARTLPLPPPLPPPPPPPARRPPSRRRTRTPTRGPMRLDELIPILLVQIALILGLSRLMGALFARFHQPQVVGEMVAGIMLGPSLLGLVTGYLFHRGWVVIDL